MTPMPDRWAAAALEFGVAHDLPIYLYPSLAALARRAEAEGRERAARAICDRCRAGEPLSDADECMTLGHFERAGTCHPFSRDTPGPVTGHIRCPAAAIHREAGGSPP